MPLLYIRCSACSHVSAELYFFLSNSAYIVWRTVKKTIDIYTLLKIGHYKKHSRNGNGDVHYWFESHRTALMFLLQQTK